MTIAIRTRPSRIAPNNELCSEEAVNSDHVKPCIFASATLVRWPRNALSGELRAEKAANIDYVNHRRIVFRD